MSETGLVTRQPGEVVYTPQEVVENATTQAKLLMSIVEQTKCYQTIADKKYLQVEAWETIGAFNRTHAETECIEPIIVDGVVIGYRAHVQLFKDGIVAGGAWMPCYFTENCCKGKEGDAKHKSCMSAAQTFATSKAYRMNYSYVAILAGYQPMPAEEITEDMKGGSKQSEPDKTQHWCKEHNTAFFMRGKMKSYAHPIKDSDNWCHEPSEAKETKSEPKPTVEKAVASTPVASEPKAGSSPGPNGKTPTKRDPATIKNIGELTIACKEDFGFRFQADMLEALSEVHGKKITLQDIVDPAAEYKLLADTKKT